MFTPYRLRILASLFAAILCLLVATNLPATTLARLSLDQLAVAANAIARLRCVNVREGWENGVIWTTTTFDVVQTYKGALPAQVLVRLPGGRTGHLVSAVDGAPRFTAGEQAIVFLEGSSAGGYTVTGWVEGTFRIARDARSGQEYVSQDSSAFAVFNLRTRAFEIEGVRRMPIEEFRERLTAAIGRNLASKGGNAR